MATSSHRSTYRSVVFGVAQCRDSKIRDLFDSLAGLSPMNKNGPMSGRCDAETAQMEQFLKRTFGFQNIPGQYIVPGVCSFQLDKFPDHMQPTTQIHFPHKSSNSFVMTAEEIIQWQRSFKVYADRELTTKDWLQQALQGRSRDGVEAFRMKFVVRISTCPIFMEFDAQVIPRTLEENWPHRIKLVSVTGIDFAGRKHDVGDILEYIANWKDVFKVDRITNLPALRNDRDFLLREGGPAAKLNETYVFESLVRMAKLRLRACDREGVQIVVETGIGLGVFAGGQIGIDAEVRKLSAKAVRTALQTEYTSYRHICAVVFALPVFHRSRSHQPMRYTFDDFTEEFHGSGYNGPIPVLIADQDMHRLTVAIARLGYTVSELNPADSHGVFGEYWQNRGPAVEEKLALTTAGLLVQHHLINLCVTNPVNYYLI